MLLWLWLYNSDSFQMWPNLLVTFYYVDFFNIINRSPTSQTCYHYISSRTSVTKINVNSELCSNQDQTSLCQTMWSISLGSQSSYCAYKV